jgi:ADP-ribose pyrophosphatase YjhB (NUDIX family)
MVFDANSRVFLAKRGPLARNERHHWEFPGGKVLLHERLKHAIRREFREEFGMVIEPGQLLCIADHLLEEEDQHWVSACFIARHVSGEPMVKEPDKCLGVDWFSLSELPTPLTQISSSFLQAYQDQIGMAAGDPLKKGLQLPRYINQLGRP